MTDEALIKAARDSGIELYGLGKNREKWLERLHKFANIVTKQCAKVCIKNADDGTEGEWDDACISCADKILRGVKE